MAEFQVQCREIIVSGADYGSCDGRYKILTRNESYNGRQVYWRTDRKRVLFFNPLPSGWSIGSDDALFEGGGYYHRSKNSPVTIEHNFRDGEVTFEKELGSSYFQMRNLGTLVTSVTVTTSIKIWPKK